MISKCLAISPKQVQGTRHETGEPTDNGAPNLVLTFKPPPGGILDLGSGDPDILQEIVGQTQHNLHIIPPFSPTNEPGDEIHFLPGIVRPAFRPGDKMCETSNHLNSIPYLRGPKPIGTSERHGMSGFFAAAVFQTEEKILPMQRSHQMRVPVHRSNSRGTREGKAGPPRTNHNVDEGAISSGQT